MTLDFSKIGRNSFINMTKCMWNPSVHLTFPFI